MSEQTNRVVKVLLDREQLWQPTGAQKKLQATALWIELKRHSYLCAAFGNQLLNQSYAAAKGFEATGAYTDYSDKLSAAVRDAISRECVGVWRRLGKAILRGEQTLARFSAARAIVVRDRGVRLKRDGDSYALLARLKPQSEGEATALDLFCRDEWLKAVLDKIIAGEYQLTKATLRFRGQKADVLLHYSRPERAPTEDRATAVVWIRDDRQVVERLGGASFSLAHWIYNLARMKEQFAGIHNRLRATWNRRGAKQKWRFRRALVRAGSFEKWSENFLHEVSRKIVDWCVENKVGTLQWSVEHSGDLPLHQLALYLQYKCQDQGIAFSKTDAPQKQKSGLRQKQHRSEKQKLKLSGSGERSQ